MRSLITNQIHDTCRSHDKPMPLLRRLDGSLTVTSPTINNCSVGNPGIGQFIPSHDFFPFALHIFTHSRHKITLQRFFVLQAFLSHTFLTKRTLLPMRFPSLIPTQMNIPGGKQLHHLINHPLQESEHTIISCTEDHIRMTSSQSWKDTDKFIDHRTSQQRIRSQRRITMSRHLNFRNHFNLMSSGIRHYLTDILLSIKSFFYSRFTLPGITTLRKRFSRTIYTP